MEKGNIRITPKVFSVLAAGVLLITPATGLANDNQITQIIEEIKQQKLKPGTLIKSKQGEYDYYIATNDDNASVISKMLCENLGMKKEGKFWPVIALLNTHIYPGYLHEGDVVFLPNTTEKLEKLYEYYDSNHMITDYKVKNNVYGRKKILPKEPFRQLLIDIYGGSVCVDDDFLLKYLKETKLDKKYELGDGEEFEGDMGSDITIYIPDLRDFDDDLYVFDDNTAKELKLTIIRKMS